MSEYVCTNTHILVSSVSISIILERNDSFLHLNLELWLSIENNGFGFFFSWPLSSKYFGDCLFLFRTTSFFCLLSMTMHILWYLVIFFPPPEYRFDSVLIQIYFFIKIACYGHFFPSNACKLSKPWFIYKLHLKVQFKSFELANDLWLKLPISNGW